jgi:threonine synthase
MTQNKYYLQCTECKHITPNFQAWFAQNQACPDCGSKHSEVWYNTDYAQIPQIFKGDVESIWDYFDFLPLNNRENIISRKEGGIPLEQWGFLEKYAKEKFGINITVNVYRNDLSGGTGTFKDVAASLAASVFKEHGIEQYCVASTGNTANAFAMYLSIAGVNCSVFIPENSFKSVEASISAYGQQVVRVKGDYARAKAVGADYAKKYNILSSTGNIDPLRVEAKKIMVFEWLRMKGKMPDVYIQAVSGGTAPIALEKGIREVKPLFPEITTPRMILVQPDKCDPMVQAWEKAQNEGFPNGFEKNYPVIDNPQTCVPILSTGNPGSYPVVAKLVKKSNGTFIRTSEEKLADFGRLIAFESKVMLGPASAVCVAGFFDALRKGLIKNGETVLLNVGEGVRCAPQFVEQMTYTTKNVESVEECSPHTIQSYSKQLWNAIEK